MKIYLVRVEYGSHSTILSIKADNVSEAIMKANDAMKGRKISDYEIISIRTVKPLRFDTIADFETDRVYVVIKESADGTLEKGNHVWVSSNSPDSLNCLEGGGWLDKEDINQESVFSAEFEVDNNYVCITILEEDSRVMSKSFFESNVIIKGGNHG